MRINLYICDKKICFDNITMIKTSDLCLNMWI